MSCSVTREASGRGLESCEMPTHLWTARGTRPPAVENRSLPAGSYRKLVTPPPGVLSKPVVCSRQVVTNHVKLGASRVGSDRLRHVGEARHSHR